MTALNPIALRDLLFQSGFTAPDPLRRAWAVAMRESGGDPEAVSPVNPNGTRDWGLFQVNDVHRTELDWTQILNGFYNARYAYRLTNGGVDWSHWGLGKTGWAGYVLETAPEVWAVYQSRFKSWYDRYPEAIANAATLAQPGVVSMANLRPGLRNEDVRELQVMLRRYVGIALNPSGATGFYGAETAAMVKAAYEKRAVEVGNATWLRPPLTQVGKGLAVFLGLRVA